MGMAAGGGVPMPAPQQGGGLVPQHMNPSGGRKVDDIPATVDDSGKPVARLNSDEFVVPRDVAMWKGQEFFQKLIQQSRKARVGAPAHPTSGPAPQGRPTFVSQQAA